VKINYVKAGFCKSWSSKGPLVGFWAFESKSYSQKPNQTSPKCWCASAAYSNLCFIFDTFLLYRYDISLPWLCSRLTCIATFMLQRFHVFRKNHQLLSSLQHAIALIWESLSV
jgi:hypothetical protein